MTSYFLLKTKSQISPAAPKPNRQVAADLYPFSDKCAAPIISPISAAADTDLDTMRNERFFHALFAATSILFAAFSIF